VFTLASVSRGDAMKVIVIEDEAVIRRGIIKKVQWEKYQIHQVFEADNGETGYEIIIRENPDIIILDINLPKLNGIDLLKKVRSENINSKVIILSGHDEFEYAQQAIACGVENYLLKPSYPKEIERVLAKVSADILTSFEKEKNNEEMKKKLEEMIPFYKTGLINSIITGNSSSENEIINLSAYFNIDIKSEYYIVVVILIENTPTSPENMEEILINKIELYQLIKEVVDADHVLVDSTLSGKVLMLLSGDNEIELKKNCFFVINRIVDESLLKTCIPVKVGIGNVCRGIRNIKDSYTDALSALENQFLDSSNQIYFIGDVILSNCNLSNYPYEDEKKFLNYIRLGKRDSAIDSLGKLMVFLKTEKDRYPINLIKIHLKQLVYYMVQIVYELGGDISDLYENVNVMEHVEGFSHIDEYKDYINTFTEKLCEYITKKRYIKYNSIMRKILLYIEENFSDDSLGLEQIAEHVSMHPNYVSHLFKKERGESLTSYICQFRIRKAQDIILKSLSVKVSDIAFEVGFNDAHYFTTCFKNIVGVTPTEYKSLRNN